MLGGHSKHAEKPIKEEGDHGGSPGRNKAGGIDMKWVALLLLVLQNTALVLLMRASLTAPGEHYILTTAVACMEGIKVVACLIMEGWNVPSVGTYVQHLQQEIFDSRELAMVAVPSLLYTFQNNLLYIALANLDAATYQVRKRREDQRTR
jgi:solute carrier family 35 (UDP-sugar transporter), member A1/2/3